MDKVMQTLYKRSINNLNKMDGELDAMIPNAYHVAVGEVYEDMMLIPDKKLGAIVDKYSGDSSKEGIHLMLRKLKQEVIKDERNGQE